MYYRELVMRYVLALVLLGVLSTPAWAAFQGPSSGMATSTVRDALGATWDDTKMCLEGKIVNKIATSTEKYTLTDATGSMVVEIDDKIMATVNITPANTVRVCGEVDKKMGRDNQLDGKSIQVLQ